MSNQITRRDFLKMSGLLPLSIAAPRIVNRLSAQDKQPNILIVVFDAFSAQHISLHGYQRETTPNLARLAERAVVYHNHYANGSFTTPGTASLLTGTMPWTHRAFSYNKEVDDDLVRKNIFSAFPDYYQVAYSHNLLVNTFFRQFREDLDEFVPMERLFVTSDDIIPALFQNDEDIATIGWIRTIKRREEGYAYSMFLAHLYEKYRDVQVAALLPDYPRGLPGFGIDNYFLLDDAINWLGNEHGNFPQPFIGYFHFFPPHAPYRTHRDFYGRFENDGWAPITKPFDIFSPEGDRSYSKLERMRRSYDEFILNVDQEFGRLYDYLQASGLIDNTWIVLTSDHGEMFERGIRGHLKPVLYEPVIRIPLMMFEPGRQERLDIHTPTSAIDVLPTLLKVAGQNQADWSEGAVLPPFADDMNELANRDVYILDAKHNEKYAPFSKATVALVKENYKLAYFFGYDELGGGERFELYDLERDPEELTNLYLSKRETGAELLNKIKKKLVEVNEPFL